MLGTIFNALTGNSGFFLIFLGDSGGKRKKTGGDKKTKQRQKQKNSNVKIKSYQGRKHTVNTVLIHFPCSTTEELYKNLSNANVTLFLSFYILV